MQAASTDQPCILSYQNWSEVLDEKENIYNAPCKTIKATTADFAKIQAVINDKNKPTCDICGAVGVKRKPEKRPERMYEAQQSRYRGKNNETE